MSTDGTGGGKAVGARGEGSGVLEEGFDDLEALLLCEVAEDPSFMDGMADIADRKRALRVLVAHRKEQHLSQTDVAASMGTTQSAVSDLEGGGNDFYLSTLQRYARAVGARIEVRAVGRPLTAGTGSPTISTGLVARDATVQSLGWRHTDEPARQRDLVIPRTP